MSKIIKNRKILGYFAIAIMVVVSFAFIPQSVLAVYNYDHVETGSISVCKIIIDSENNIVNGAELPSVTFTISGFATTSFTTPLTLNADLIGNDGINDSECVLHENIDLELQDYSVETYPAQGWETPLYNDQWDVLVGSLSDFFFYNDPGNLNSDGLINLGEPDRTSRTLVILNQYKALPIYGCTDPSALNYNPDATIDDQSCQYPPVVIPGCMDSNALNYNASATVDDGTCQYPPVVIPGCMDSNALNYNASATVDDGTCQYPPVEKPGCMNPVALNYDPTATVDSGSCQYPGGGSPSISGGVTNIPEIIVKGKEAFPELIIEKTVNKDLVDSGTYVFYTIKVTNNGDADAINLVIEDTLPKGFINDNNSSEVVWEIPLLKKEGGIWTKTFPIYISQSVESGDYENIATAKAENHLDEVKDFVIVKVGTLPHTGVSSFTWFIIGGFAILFIGILGLVSIFTKKYRQIIQFIIFGSLIIGALVALSYPFFPVIKYNLSIPVVNSEEIEEEIINVEGDWLIIPSIGVEIPIVLGQDDSALEKGAWLLPNGSTPDSGGNTALAAHRFKYKPPYKETFYLLDKVKNGDLFYVYWKGEKYIYTVTSSVIVEPEAIEVLDQTEESIITLITCTPLFSDKNRLVVVGELVI